MRKRIATETQLNRARILDVLDKTWPKSFNRKMTASIFKRGMPDNLCCIEGYFVAIEAKKEGEKPTTLQESELMKVAQAGGVSLCVTFNRDGSMSALDYTISSRSMRLTELRNRILATLGILNARHADFT